jgi:CRISPR-associated protein Cmr2
MSRLLAISVGPVQEFIAAARRTRDLWFGSYLLSEISRAVANAVELGGGKLIFPAKSDAENVANVILAELPDGGPNAIATKAKEAAKRRWKEFADETWQRTSVIIRSEIWNEQVDDVIEFYAAWVTCSTDYRADRSKVMRLLAGRKNCRDFLPAKGRAGVPKSSLDGQRETVLKNGDRANWPKSLRLSTGEQLDVVGMVKRMAEGTQPYPSVARIAAETWLSGIEKQGKLKPLKAACAKLLTKGLHTVHDENYDYFPYEGTVIYKDRHPDLRKELGLGDTDLDEVADVLRKIAGEPLPYVAVLVADGDGMGKALSRLESGEDHRTLSKKLATFAEAAKAIVAAKEHSGVLVYAGGDDVLAFVPVHTCLPCARALRTRFYQGTGLTLSVGIAVGHFMENLEDLLEYGRDAEKAAKKVEGKDALAVHLHKRGGSPVKIAASWTNDPDKRLTRFAELIQLEAIPSKLPYDLRKLADLYDGWKRETDDERRLVVESLHQDVIRVVRDKQPRSGRQYMSEIEATVNSFTNPDDLKQFVQQLLVARQITEALKQAKGEK